LNQFRRVAWNEPAVALLQRGAVQGSHSSSRYALAAWALTVLLVTSVAVVIVTRIRSEQVGDDLWFATIPAALLAALMGGVVSFFAPAERSSRGSWLVVVAGLELLAVFFVTVFDAIATGG
jgi:hypothetical protein